MHRTLNALSGVAVLLPVTVLSLGVMSPAGHPESARILSFETDQITSLGNPEGLVYALLADGRLIAVNLERGTIVAEHDLSPRTVINTTRHLIGRTKNGKKLFVLLPGPQGRVIAVDTTTGRISTIFESNDRAFRSLAVGPTTGRIYLFGNDGPTILISVLDPEGKPLSTWKMIKPEGFDWAVYQGATSVDERRLFVSYHGAARPNVGIKGTTGADWFDVTPQGITCCPQVNPSNVGCMDSHGGFAVYKDGLLTATGGSRVLEIAGNGKVRQAFDTGLDGNHLLEFTIDANQSRLYAVGSCGYVPGFSVVDLERGGSPVAADPEFRFGTDRKPPLLFKGGICGERLTLASNDLLILAKTGKPVPDATIPGGLVFLNRATGQVIRTVATPSEPVDLLATSEPRL